MKSFAFLRPLKEIEMELEALKNPTFKAGLFDLDGVIVDTEPQYTIFWGTIGREYHPEIPDFAHIIKGQTLTQISDRWLNPEDLPSIVRRLNEFEHDMEYNYIPGAFEYLEKLAAADIRTAVVTSSNQIKMESVWRNHPELLKLFDRVLTSEDFKASKPDPDCYQLGARIFGLEPSSCVVFEDSFAGVASGRSADCAVAGLATTNAAADLAPLCDIVIPDFTVVL